MKQSLRPGLAQYLILFVLIGIFTVLILDYRQSMSSAAEIIKNQTYILDAHHLAYMKLEEIETEIDNIKYIMNNN